MSTHEYRDLTIRIGDKIMHHPRETLPVMPAPEPKPVSTAKPGGNRKQRRKAAKIKASPAHAARKAEQRADYLGRVLSVVIEQYAGDEVRISASKLSEPKALVFGDEGNDIVIRRDV